MAVDTRSKRASAVGLHLPFVAVPVLPDGTLAQGDRQHIAFSYSGIAAATDAALAFVLDLNTRIAVYLRDFYTAPTAEVTPLTGRYLNTLTGDMTARWRTLVQDATDAMT